MSNLKKVSDNYLINEQEHVDYLIQNFTWDNVSLSSIKQTAEELINNVRNKRIKKGGFDALLAEYDLSNTEGIALMCLAEALLRTPDKFTIDKLIKDKMSNANWKKHLGKDKPLFVNAATWCLAITGNLLQSSAVSENSLLSALSNLVQGSKEAIIRKAIQQSMRMLGEQFILGFSIEQALEKANTNIDLGFNYSFDMLGEAAKTQKDADMYFDKYFNAIKKIGETQDNKTPVTGQGISIKLSALHPRYEGLQEDRVLKELLPKLFTLIKLAKEYNMGLTIDAEEANRLTISLLLIEKVISSDILDNWEGFGIAVQAYQKRAPFLIDWVAEVCKKHNKKICMRLVKGAYWDSEIKKAQELGLEDYPVFTKKNSTDLSYLYCAKKLFEYNSIIFPQFATHNAFTVAAINEMAPKGSIYEFQCLHGMGETLYDDIVTGRLSIQKPCRIYAPVGQHNTLLAYLVRRILENGANSSFVNQILDKNISVENLTKDPLEEALKYEQARHKNIPSPIDLYKQRKNSKGIEFNHIPHIKPILNEIKDNYNLIAKPSFSNEGLSSYSIQSPSTGEVIGTTFLASEEVVNKCMESATVGYKIWDKLGHKKRARIIEKAGLLLEERINEFTSLLMIESGKTVSDAVAEVREAIDFCRYYAVRVKEDFQIKYLEGPTGEINQLSLHGRGILVCISPWNFPLAIFAGQVVASLIAGNSVIAKPASQTPLIAQKFIDLLYEAGVYEEALHFLPIKGSDLQKQVLIRKEVKGVIFTGSTHTAQRINQELAKNETEIIPLVAETGGLNCMVIDSTTLLEQAVDDIMKSAFYSAGQRCSALRVLFVQEDIEKELLEMLTGAMDELKIGTPIDTSVDIGPVIDEAAMQELNAHIENMQSKVLHQCSVPQTLNFVAPTIIKLNHISELEKEIFGPVLHVITYQSNKLHDVVEQINSTGFGLTLGIHSRIQETIDYVSENSRVGNCYINRNMVGAVVGVQPFGGEGASGTGPKAGGPHYLPKLAVERTISNNTSAIGGNTTLMSL